MKTRKMNTRENEHKKKMKTRSEPIIKKKK